jgi:hypothetical protein
MAGETVFFIMSFLMADSSSSLHAKQERAMKGSIAYFNSFITIFCFLEVYTDRLFSLQSDSDRIGLLHLTITGNYSVLAGLAEISPHSHSRSYDTIFGSTTFWLQFLDVGTKFSYPRNGVVFVIDGNTAYQYVPIIRSSQYEGRDVTFFTVSNQQTIIIYRIIIA